MITVTVSNGDPLDFCRHHLKVKAVSEDGETIVWTIPERLLLNIDLSTLIIRELLEAMNDKLAVSNRPGIQRPASA